MSGARQLRKLRSADRVAGHRLPPPRPTGWAALYALVWLGLPVLVLLLVADLLLYLAFTGLLGRCYGIACLFG
jgi:hypothetical protein